MAHVLRTRAAHWRSSGPSALPANASGRAGRPSAVASSVGVLLLCLVARAPPAAATSPEDCTACAAAPAEEDCSSSVCRVSLLQGRHEVTSPKASESAALGAKLFPRKPNIVLFLSDDMFLKEYSPWHPSGFAPAVPSRIPVTTEPINNGGVMPNLEKIAQSGATFARAYTASPSCTPSRYSIMTGRHPSRSLYGFDKVSEYFPGMSEGFVGQYSMLGQGYEDQMSTVGIALQSLGYATGMMGKWHLTPSEEANFSSPYSDQTAHVMRSGFDFVDGLYITNMCDCSQPICDTFNHNLEWMLDRALYFMDDAMTKEKPFFLYFSPTPPHHPSAEDSLLGHFTPYQTPAGTLASAPDVSKYCSSCKLAKRKEIWDSVADISSMSEKGSCRHLLAALRWIDESLGVLYDFLSERDVIGDTYIVVSSDHGAGKYSLYELGTRVPLYAAGPGIQAGTVVEEPVIHMDLAPTFLTWAGDSEGASMPMSSDGLSWSSLVSGEASSLDRESITTQSYFDTATVTREGMKRYASRTSLIINMTLTKLQDPVLIDECSSLAKDLSLIVGDAYPALYEEVQVYNIFSDPTEQNNLERV